MEGKVVLDSLLEDEKSLRKKAKDLKSDLEGLNSEIVSKQNEIDSLFAKVAALKSNKREFNVSNGVDHYNDCGIQERKGIKLKQERDIEPERFAETLLHEEMWREVFSKVDDGLDLLNASRACQHFSDILDPIKNHFLFEAVLHFLLPHLDLDDVLKCRLVCKDWRFGINSFLEHWSESEMIDFASRINYLHPFPYITIRVIRAYTFVSDPNDFLQKFNSARNPFIANSISISLEDDFDEPAEELKFRRGIDTILENFGRHIHHFEWFGRHFTDEFSRPVVAELLRKLLSKAKNLQTLVLNDATSLQYLNYGDDNFPKLSIEDVTDSLPNFKTLVYSMDDRFPIGNWLFRNFHLQITKLHLFSLDGLIAASKFSWPLVTELGFHIYATRDISVRDLLKSFESYPILNKLVIFATESQDLTPTIFQTVRSLSKICPRFHFLVWRCSMLFSSDFLQNLYRQGTVVAPKELETFELIFIDKEFLITFDFAFLLRFPYIKKLSILVDPDLYRKWERNSKQGDKLEIVELRKYLKPNSNPRSSNVWRMLPNLETLQIQNNIYKRPKPDHTKSEN